MVYWQSVVWVVVISSLLAMVHGFIKDYERKNIWWKLGNTVRRGRRGPSVVTGQIFPVKVADLIGVKGPEFMQLMLRDTLPDGVRVVNVVVDLGKPYHLKDGVKGEKAIAKLTYNRNCEAAPKEVFVKFNLNKTSIMRFLVDLTACTICEGEFFARLAKEVKVMRPPTHYFCDYSVTGEFVSVTSVIRPGKDFRLPFKHRIRDETTLEEQLLLCREGAKLNAQFWGGAGIINFHEKNRDLHRCLEMTGLLMGKTIRGEFEGGVGPGHSFVTWKIGKDVADRIGEVCSKMTLVYELLSNENVAFGHNDIVPDNVVYKRHGGRRGVLELSEVFDWQQACDNNVGSERAWNLHFLDPEFLTKHEDRFIEEILFTYEKAGVQVTKEEFIKGYCLGCLQMFVWGGIGLQFIFGGLSKVDMIQNLKAGWQWGDGHDLGIARHELALGAEMTRRTFTNVCNIMERHSFMERFDEVRGQRVAKRRDTASELDAISLTPTKIHKPSF